ncbi:DUF5959 family protein [Streptomyces flaveolus]|uniref:DUF5959 family protein n=1 Tax=Streptomyces flaveolus TaxID=67297 RepID=UPI0036F5B74A
MSPADLDEWEHCLDALEAENGAVWPAGDRSAWMDLSPLERLVAAVTATSEAGAPWSFAYASRRLAVHGLAPESHASASRTMWSMSSALAGVTAVSS